MALIDSYKITLDLLKDFIEKEEKEKITEKIAIDLAEIFKNGGKALIVGMVGATVMPFILLKNLQVDSEKKEDLYLQ